MIKFETVEDDDSVCRTIIVMRRPRGVDAEGERVREGVGEMTS
ncbi:hypothetical protein HSB1_42990 [Halogranum salarium B-1]|uniref:Uncharacterized protein n=1 Tax=Halogranum salarium B-1 TaxID=1210908 RepID=J3JDB3_9EURY|nr:hypothetical protein HSB1_42990 [Halogranum salarium B-1]